MKIRPWRNKLSFRTTGALALFFLSATAQEPPPVWPTPSIVSPIVVSAEEDSWVRNQEVCLAQSGAFAGTLGDTLAYRYQRQGNTLRVSYFAYWSSESPWGHESLVRSLLIDSVYTHFLFVTRGLQYFIFGPGDVEGAQVSYRIEHSSSGRATLTPLDGQAEGRHHEQVSLTPKDLRSDNGSTWLLSDAWSHQLGAHGASDWASRAGSQCFSGRELIPLSLKLASDFRIGSEQNPRRARSAWLQ